MSIKIEMLNGVRLVTVVGRFDKESAIFAADYIKNIYKTKTVIILVSLTGG